MSQNEILLLKGDEIFNLFQDREKEVMEAVKDAYVVHRKGDSCLPHSSFVNFPNKEKERIIALPAYLGGRFDIAGMKWIASFPGNLAKGLERASAQLTINSTETGFPMAFMESSIISAKRTAASAVLAADYLRDDLPVKTVGLVGCGLINFETVRFLLAARPEIETIRVFDLSRERGDQFVSKCRELSADTKYEFAGSLDKILSSSDVVALATTAVKPYITDLSSCDAGTVILHTSLRDFTANVMLESDNLVDDVDHAVRANTSLHLAEQEAGNRDFIRCEIADVFTKDQAPRPDANKIRIFSPFGLGVLDLALAKMIYELAREQGKGTTMDSFMPAPWFAR